MESGQLKSHLLSKHKAKFIAGLSSFESPNSKSAAIIKTGQVKWREKSYPVDKNQQDFVLQLSEIMQLDEVQSYSQFQNFMRTQVKGYTFGYDTSTSEQILAFYCDERIAVINCLAAIVRGAQNPNCQYFTEFSTFVKSLLKEKLLDEVVKQYTMLTKVQVSSRLSRQQTEKWATQYVLEQLAVLEVIFLLHYSLVQCDLAHFHRYAELFLSNAFGTRQVNYSSLNDVGRTTTKRIKYLQTMLLLEMLTFEIYLDPRKPASLPPSEIDRMEKSLMHWGTLDAHGPILLAWAAILSTIGFLPSNQNSMASISSTDRQLSAPDFFYKSFQLHPIEFLLSAIKELEPTTSKPTMLAYKSVLRGFLSLLTKQENLELYPQLVELQTAIFKGQAQLCQHFWASYATNPASGGVLATATERFPMEITPLLRLFTSLIGDSNCANDAFWYLSHMNTYLQIFPAEIHSRIEEIGQITDNDSAYPHFNAVHPIEVDAITIPPGTKGRLVSPRSSDQSPFLIQWNIQTSAWPLLLAMIDSFIMHTSPYSQQIFDPQELYRVSCVIDLLAELFSKFDELAVVLEGHLQEEFFRTSGYYGSVQDFELLKRMTNILDYCAYLPNPPISLLESTLRCIKGIGKSQPIKTWHNVRRSLIATVEESPMMKPGPIRHLLDYECSIGRYKVTLAWLDLSQSLLEMLQATMSRSDQDFVDLEDFMPSLLFIQSSIFTQYETWRYQSLKEKSEIGHRILRIFEDILHDTSTSSSRKESNLPKGNENEMDVRYDDSTATTGISQQSSPSHPTSSTVQEYLFNSFLFDVSFHSNLLNILSIGPNGLEISRKSAVDSESLHAMVRSAFTVLEFVLLLKQRAIPDNSRQSESQNNYALPMEQQMETDEMDITPLETSILQRKVGKAGQDLIYVLASYVSYNFDQVIPPKAVQLLTILCGLSQRSPPPSSSMSGNSMIKSSASSSSSSFQTVSLVAYFGYMAETIKTEFLHKLMNNRESSDLRVAILDLATKSLGTQPGLAVLFLNVQGADSDESKTTAAKAGHVEAPSSCVAIVLSLFMDDDLRKWYLENDPRLLSAALAFLEALWNAASDHSIILANVRSSPNFWTKLFACLTPTSLESKMPISIVNDQDIAANKIYFDCYRMQINAHVFQIVALEVFFVPYSGPIDSDLLAELKKLTKEDGKLLHVWLDRVSTCHLDMHLQEEFLDNFRSTNIELESLTQLFSKKIYGTQYNYDIQLLKKKLGLPRQGVVDFTFATDEYKTFVKKQEYRARLLAASNIQLSKVDATLHALHSIRNLLQMMLLRQPKLVWLDKIITLRVMQLLAKKVGEERREYAAVKQNNFELASILQLFARQYTFFKQPPSTSAAPSSTTSALGQTSLSTTLPVPTNSASKLASLSPEELVLGIVDALQPSLQWHAVKQSSDTVVTTLLCTAHILLKSVKNWDFDLQNVALTLAVTCTTLIERPPLFKVALSLLETIVAHTQHTTALIKTLGDRNTVVVLVNDLAQYLASRTEHEKAESIAFFFLALANAHPTLAEILAASNFPLSLCTEPWISYVRDVMTAYSSNGERNPWQHIWVVSISTMARLLHVMRYQENFVNNALEFVNSHRYRVLRSLDLHSANYQPADAVSSSKKSTSDHHHQHGHGFRHASKSSQFGSQSSKKTIQESHLRPDTAITLGNLEETESMTVLIFQLATFRNLWRISLDGPEDNYSVASALEHNILSLFQQVSLVVSHHTDIMSSAKAISSSERKRITADSQTSTQLTGTDTTKNAPATSTTPDIATSSTSAATANFGKQPAKLAAAPTKFSAIPKVSVPATTQAASTVTSSAPTATSTPLANQTKPADGDTNDKKLEDGKVNEPAGTNDRAKSTAPVATDNPPDANSLLKTSQAAAPTSNNNLPKVSPMAAEVEILAKPKQPTFHEKVSLCLYRILRNTISLVRKFTPSIATENGDPELFTPVFDPLPTATFASTPTLGLLSTLVINCVSNLKRLTNPPESTATGSKHVLTKYQREEVSLGLYIIETAIFILISHIQLYLSSEYTELVRRRVRDEIGYELESTLMRLSKDWTKLSDSEFPPFLKQAQSYLQMLKTY